MRKLSMDDLNRKTVEEFKAAEKIPVTIVLDNIRSMHNVGSVFRSADAFLVEKIILCGFSPRPPHRDIHKTALGATETVEWSYNENIIEAVRELKQNNHRIYAVEQAEKSIALNRFLPDNDKKLAVIFGNEVEGVNASLLSLTDGCIEIPQFGMKHSLNVSVAAGIVLWEIFKFYRND